jgi:2-iminobutanoate/2-iminopropanoate deaminase
MSEHDHNTPSDAAVLPRCIFTPNAPTPVGHYCQGVVAGGFVFVSGQGGLLPNGGGLIPGGAGAEARQAITNITEILKAAHPRLTLRSVTRVTIYYTDIERDAAAVNAVYKEMFSFDDQYKPARMVFQVAKQPIADARVSIDAQALLPI